MRISAELLEYQTSQGKYCRFGTWGDDNLDALFVIYLQDVLLVIHLGFLYLIIHVTDDILEYDNLR